MEFAKQSMRNLHEKSGKHEDKHKNTSDQIYCSWHFELEAVQTCVHLQDLEKMLNVDE